MIFTHARNSTTLHDPDSALAEGMNSGAFDVPCTLPPDSAAVTDALQHQGTMPISGTRWLGMSTGQLVLVGASAVLLLAGVVLIGVSSGPSDTPGLVTGVVLGVIGLAVGAITAVSVRARHRNLLLLAAAWQNGWLRFAPAEVGAVWVDRTVQHGQKRHDRVNQDNRYWYRALVQVHPTDGHAPFTVTTEPFQALGDRDGRPHDLRTAPGPLDSFEPEYANGWTVARYVAGDAASCAASATVTTNLSDDQVRAALAAAGHAGH